MTWTSAFGRTCGWLLDRIVHGFALTRISPNVLTFIGLVINIVAAWQGRAVRIVPLDDRRPPTAYAPLLDLLESLASAPIDRFGALEFVAETRS